MVKCLVAKLADLQGNPLKSVTAEGKQICLARLESGEVFALSDICSHEWIELSDGDLDGEDVECPAHGSRFNVRTGEVSGLPAEEPVATYPVVVEDDEIYVEV
ncbi:non-heme iron oxygenase ferredoxin subunit [Amycolatopsis sp. FDAARGOS 1241]|uniref:Rieske (2Fe-2S) protein n=1 Tax=Amycolatopsis sp. FDAARGOS 1241 TaxID=2778070 RepID=UPI0019513AD6|nr:non-heme iron oxygenase ferredoxin subunit [Amycolatopsis sp. FDAARGOS 1241]QRP42828.1 non-heme iron oxygenase ferredoxin subunit [Amycolatopsis sp. FDAARGOS 1241]